MLLHGVVVEELGNFRFPSFIKVMCIQFVEDVTLLSTEPHILPHLILLGKQDGSVTRPVMTRMIRFPVGARELSLLQSFGDLSASNFVGTGKFSTTVERLWMKLTKYCHLMLTSMSGALLPFHAAYAFM